MSWEKRGKRKVWDVVGEEEEEERKENNVWRWNMSKNARMGGQHESVKPRHINPLQMRLSFSVSVSEERVHTDLNSVYSQQQVCIKFSPPWSPQLYRPLWRVNTRSGSLSVYLHHPEWEKASGERWVEEIKWQRSQSGLFFWKHGLTMSFLFSFFLWLDHNNPVLLNVQLTDWVITFPALVSQMSRDWVEVSPFDVKILPQIELVLVSVRECLLPAL